jgi:beta-lactamase regulating signal transducer with metallopeptidase domain
MNTSHGKENKESIKGKVIAGVASGLILAAIFYFVPRLVHWIVRVFISIWNHLTASTHIPNWLLWILVILSLITVVRRIKFLMEREVNNDPTFRMYTHDSFEGLT